MNIGEVISGMDSHCTSIFCRHWCSLCHELTKQYHSLTAYPESKTLHLQRETADHINLRYGFPCQKCRSSSSIIFIYLLNLQKEEKGPGMSYIHVCTHWLEYEYPLVLAFILKHLSKGSLQMQTHLWIWLLTADKVATMHLHWQAMQKLA